MAVMVAAWCAAGASGQNAVKVGVGAVRASLDVSLPCDVFGEKTWTCSPFIGADYLEHKYWYLSSELRYIRLGAKDTPDLKAADISGAATTDLQWDYLQLNTTFRLQCPLRGMKAYVGAGLFANCCVGGREHGAYNFTPRSRAVTWGEVFEFGVTSVIGRVKVDLNAAYDLPNGHAASAGLTEITPRAWVLSVSAGYVL